jgi:acyl-CoA reductase-like NAD-dependent aldehyde dehydrogenase
MIPERANDTFYGLVACVVTNDINKALTFAHGQRRLRLGEHVPRSNAADTIWRFQDVRPGQGGRTGQRGSIRNYVETKTVTIAIPNKYS